jgi:hypothetical protein
MDATFGEGRQKLMEARRDTGEVRRADDNLADRQRKARQFQRPLAEPQRFAHERSQRNIDGGGRKARQGKNQNCPVIQA